MEVEPREVLRLCALAVTVVMIANAVFLFGFAQHRLRAFNIYIVLSIALVTARLYGELTHGGFGGWWATIPYINLAIGSVIGLVGMVRLAARDPKVWRRAEG